MTPNPEELRAKSRIYVQAARAETVPELKQKFANYAFALAQLAEQIERKEVGDTVAKVDLDEYHRQILEESRKLIETGLNRRSA